jgi:hypothetical protein
MNYERRWWVLRKEIANQVSFWRSTRFLAIPFGPTYETGREKADFLRYFTSN